MIKTIFLITTVSLLSACSITKDSEPAVVEDRSSVTQESIITLTSLALSLKVLLVQVRVCLALNEWQ